MSTTAVSDPPKNGTPSMGLSGWAAVIANLSAVTLMSGMFWQAQQEQYRQQREDRAMFREVIVKLEDRAERDRETNREANRDLAAAVRQLASEMKQGRQ